MHTSRTVASPVSPWFGEHQVCLPAAHDSSHSKHLAPTPGDSDLWRASPEVAPELSSAPWVNQEPCRQTRTSVSLAGSADVAGETSVLAFLFRAPLQVTEATSRELPLPAHPLLLLAIHTAIHTRLLLPPSHQPSRIWPVTHRSSI